MANPEHFEILERGTDVWNQWRADNPDVSPILVESTLWKMNLKEGDFRDSDLSGVTFSDCSFERTVFDGANLGGANLAGAKLGSSSFLRTNFNGAELSKADFSGCNLSYAVLRDAQLHETKFMGATLNHADLCDAFLLKADFRGAQLSDANLTGADARLTDFRDAVLERAKLVEAGLYQARFNRANLRDADLRFAQPVRTTFMGADLTGSFIHGISTWTVDLTDAKQENLVITQPGEPRLTVDNLEVAQFIYLLLTNRKLRDVIDTVGRKAVLILGRFTPERKAVLEAIRDELRRENYLPILFDFDVPETRDVTETVTLLAHMSRFIIADLTEPSSIPKELELIVPRLEVPVIPLIENTERPYSMFGDYRKYDWVLDIYEYEGLDGLIESLKDNVISPAEAKARELNERRNLSARNI